MVPLFLLPPLMLFISEQPDEKDMCFVYPRIVSNDMECMAVFASRHGTQIMDYYQ